MQKKTRRILFIICLVFFLSVTPLVILYSQGYRIDVDSRKITQTGGFFCRVLPKQATIYFDSKFKKKTDWFFGSALIENLLPKKHKVSIVKEGFHPWEKTLEIREKEVTTAENVILFPKNPDFAPLAEKIQNFWLSPNGKRLVFKTDFSGNESWALKLYNPERSIISHLIERKDLGQEVELIKLEFSEDSEKILLKVDTQEQIKYFSLYLNDPETISAIEKEEPLQENIVTHYKLNQEIYYLNNLGHLYQTDEDFDPQIKLSETPFPVLPETEYKLKKFGSFIFLQKDETLYVFREDSGSWEEIFTPAKNLRTSPYFTKLVYWSDFEIWVFFLEQKTSQPPKGAGERLFVIRLSEKIKDVLWLDSNYLIFTVGDKVKISEIDERDRLNIIDLAEFENSEIIFNNLNKKLYLLSNGKLYESERLLP